MSFEREIESETQAQRYKSLKQTKSNLISQLNTWKNEQANLRASLDTLDVDKKAEVDAELDDMKAQLKTLFGI